MIDQRRVVVLGSTGSIGTQALDVIRHAPDRFTVAALSAGGSDVALLAKQAAETGVPVVGVGRADAARELSERLQALVPDRLPRIVAGPARPELAAYDADVVLNAIAGAAGLRATLAALDAGRMVALANKESLIAGGPLVTSRARPGQLRPVDSEHSALAQCLRSGSAAEVRKLVVTASGGPFRGRARDELHDVTPAAGPGPSDLGHGHADHHQLGDAGQQGPRGDRGAPALRRPLRPDRGRRPPAVDRPLDGRVRRRLDRGPAVPTGHAADHLAGARLARSRARMRPPPMDWTTAQTLTFEPLDDQAFPAVALARRAGLAGGCAPAVYNAANESLVAAFHDGSIGFLQIVDTVADVLDEWLRERGSTAGNPGTVEDVEQADAWARARATELALGR